MDETLLGTLLGLVVVFALAVIAVATLSFGGRVVDCRIETFEVTEVRQVTNDDDEPFWYVTVRSLDEKVEQRYVKRFVWSESQYYRYESLEVGDQVSMVWLEKRWWGQDLVQDVSRCPGGSHE
jgi:uncharacterized OB-fold protein